MAFWRQNSNLFNHSSGGKRNVGESLRGLLDKGQRNAVKGLSNSHNLVMFSIYLQQAEAADLDAHDACGMGLMQKGRRHTASDLAYDMLPTLHPIMRCQKA